MGAFNINITGVGGHGCERKAKAGEKLYGRCGRFTCPDCAAYDFVQRLKQSGMLRAGEQANSVMLTPAVVEEARRRGIWPGQPDVIMGNTPNVVEVKAASEHGDLVPTGAMYIAFRSGMSGIEAWAAYPMKAEFTHWPGEPSAVVDDMLTNERKAGSF